MMTPSDWDVSLAFPNPVLGPDGPHLHPATGPTTAMRLHISPLPGGVPRDLGRPNLAGSKSHAQRAMLLAALMPGSWELVGATRGQDVAVLGEALEQLGSTLHWDRGRLCITGRFRPRRSVVELDLAENGTGARTLLVLLAMLGDVFRLDGREGLRRRPMGPALEVLRTAGVQVSGGSLPLAVDPGKARFPDPLLVAGHPTTQVATGAMLGSGLLASLRPRSFSGRLGLGRLGLGRLGLGRLGLGRRRVERVVQVLSPTSQGYLGVTAQVLRAFGHEVEGQAHGSDVVYRIGPRRLREGRYTVPVDPSSRTFPLVLSAMHGLPMSGKATPGDDHPEWAVDQDVEKLLGAPPSQPGGALELDGLWARPDAVPALAVLAATRNVPVVLKGLGALRHKESDRLAAIVAGLQAVGVQAAERNDDLCIHGPLAVIDPSEGPVEVPCPPDHRMVMAFSLLGTVRPGGVVVPHAAAVGKSWPGFGPWLERVAQVRVVTR